MAVPRKLASVQRIVDIQPIPNADNIEVATVLGWHCVVRKGEFKPGDLCVYFEIDSLLPMTDDFSFMKNQKPVKSYVDGKEYVGYRLKTITLRGQISQGLCLPISILKGKRYPNDTRENPVYEFKEGDDVTSLLGVVKYEPQIPANLRGEVKGPFPSNIPKTDEVRIQEFPQLLERYQGMPFYATEKVDGMSITVFVENGELNVCSRNLNLKDNDNTIWKTVKSLGLLEKLSNLDKHIALQGEFIGPGVQKNPLKLNTNEILFFNVYDIDEGKYLDYKEFVAICDKLNVKRVPLLDENFMLPKTVDELVNVATRNSVINPNVMAEGIVVRPLHEMRDEDIGRLSFKCINPKYLLKNDE